MSNVDFGRHSQDYATHRPGFPNSFYERVNAIIPIEGTRCLDLATGPGTIALEMASRGSSVLGIDIAQEQIAMATRASKERGMEPKAQFHVGAAENTGLESGSVDLVTAGQCWHWFNPSAVMKETQRVLRRNGVLVVAYYCYLAEHTPVVRDTENLILELNPSWTMAGWKGMFPELIDELIHGGFKLIEEFCYHHDEEFSHARWRGRMRTCNGVGSGGLSPADVVRFDEALGHLLNEKYPDPMVVEHRVWSVVVRNAP